MQFDQTITIYRAMPIRSTSMRDTAEDGKPLAPRRPDADECCRGGCETCVFALYEREMEQYRIALQAWQDAHARTKDKRGKRKHECASPVAREPAKR